MVEQWKAIDGYDGVYSVSDFGRVRRDAPSPGTRPGLILKENLDGSGYPKAFLCVGGIRRSVSVHRMVAQAFLGRCPVGRQINHINGNKRDNRACNLEYVTTQQNTLHAISVLGKHQRGANNHNAKFGWKEADDIRRMSAAGEKTSTIAAKFGVRYETIHRIVKGKSWILSR